MFSLTKLSPTYLVALLACLQQQTQGMPTTETTTEANSLAARNECSPTGSGYCNLVLTGTVRPCLFFHPAASSFLRSREQQWRWLTSLQTR
jgi:hypothetical protein